LGSIIFFKSKIDTYKIKNKPNIEVIENKNQTETNYIAQLIINNILSDKIKKKISMKKFKNSTVMYKKEKKSLVSWARRDKALGPRAMPVPGTYFIYLFILRGERQVVCPLIYWKK